jgi:hypothetical protein
MSDKEQMTEIDVSTEDQIKAGHDLAETLIEIEAMKERIKAERKEQKEELVTLEERRDFLRDIVKSGKRKVPAQTTLGEVEKVAADFIKTETDKGRKVEIDKETNTVTIDHGDDDDDEKAGKIQDAKVLAELILSKVNDLPEAAEDFAASVEEKTNGILEWIEENDHVTDAQIKALDNMADGVERWEENQ